MRVIQMLPTLSYGDAVGNDAIAIDRVLKKNGYKTGIYAERVGNRVTSDNARSISKLPRLKSDDILIYHLSTGTELNFKLADYGGRKIMVYHNITPSKFYSGYSFSLVNLCKFGVDGVRFLADKVDYCIADSAYNKQELLVYGYSCPVDVLPILIPFDDYRKEPNKELIERYSDDGKTNLLFTGRIAPNKCQEDIIAAFYQYHRYFNEKSRLILVGNYEGTEMYYTRLLKYAENLGISEDVIFTGHISFDEILAYYHIADIFLCMSEHEGFCVPLVEAMFFDLPIVSYDSSAIADTLGGSGILLKEKNALETAAVMDYIMKNEEVKDLIIQGQRERLNDFDHVIIETQFLKYLTGFIEGIK